jgi:hypothetical protein
MGYSHGQRFVCADGGKGETSPRASWITPDGLPGAGGEPIVPPLPCRSCALMILCSQCTLPVQPHRSGVVSDLLRWHEGCIDPCCNFSRQVDWSGN